MAQDTSTRGFAAMSKKRRSEIAAMGGSASGGNFKNDPARASTAGVAGGSKSGGNFKNDPKRASAAGRVGGSH